jgi:hypothetical protein
LFRSCVIRISRLPATAAALPLRVSRMPSSTVLHAACFAVGAIVGGGVITALESRRRVVPLPPPPSATKASAPLVEVQPTGATRITTPNALVNVEPPVLKHGNPGPISDMLVRKAYVAAYDRRLRHPAWVRYYFCCHSVLYFNLVIYCRLQNT